jgi:hypothetical protein
MAIELYQKALSNEELKQKFVKLGEEQSKLGHIRVAAKLYKIAGNFDKAKITIEAYISKKEYIIKAEKAIQKGNYATAVFNYAKIADLFNLIDLKEQVRKYKSLAADYILKIEYADIEPIVDSTILAFARENELRTGQTYTVENIPFKEVPKNHYKSTFWGFYSFPENYNYLITNNQNFIVEPGSGASYNSVMKNNALEFFETGRYLDENQDKYSYNKKKRSHVRKVDWNPVTKERKTSDLGHIIDFVFYGGMAITDNDQYLILGGFNSIQKWDIENNEKLYTYCVEKEELKKSSFNGWSTDYPVSFKVVNDGKWIVADIKYDIHIIDMESFEVVKEFDLTGKVDITSDNKIMAVGKVGRIYLYDLESGKRIGEIKLEKGEYVDFISFTKNGNAMLISSHVGDKGNSSMKEIKFFNPYNAFHYN